jgi:hypothetical protein
MEIPKSLFEKSIGRERAWYMITLIGVALLSSGLLVGSLEFGFVGFFSEGHWRRLLINPALILYILVVAPRLTRIENQVIKAVMPLMRRPESKTGKIFKEPQPVQEGIVICAGALIVTFLWVVNNGFAFTLYQVYNLVMTAASFGLLSWTVYASVLSIRDTALLLEQPLRVDLFNLAPFKVIGKSSLYLAFAFIGGVTMALLFTTPDLMVFESLEFWVINTPMFFMPIAIFFWNMYPTHKIINAAKKDTLKQVGSKIDQTSTSFMKNLESRPDAFQGGLTLMGLIAYEERLEQVQTWPYDVVMLRSLFGSILIPALTVVAQVFLRQLLGG